MLLKNKPTVIRSVDRDDVFSLIEQSRCISARSLRWAFGSQLIRMLTAASEMYQTTTYGRSKLLYVKKPSIVAMAENEAKARAIQLLRDGYHRKISSPAVLDNPNADWSVTVVDDTHYAKLQIIPLLDSSNLRRVKVIKGYYPVYIANCYEAVKANALELPAGLWVFPRSDNDYLLLSLIDRKLTEGFTLPPNVWMPVKSKMMMHKIADSYAVPASRRARAKMMNEAKNGGIRNE